MLPRILFIAMVKVILRDGRRTKANSNLWRNKYYVVKNQTPINLVLS